MKNTRIYTLVLLLVAIIAFGQETELAKSQPILAIQSKGNGDSLSSLTDRQSRPNLLLPQLLPLNPKPVKFGGEGSYVIATATKLAIRAKLVDKSAETD